MDNYEKLEQLGSGSYGNVWKIRRKSDGKHLVWKDINFGKMSEREKSQLVAEVNILRELRNPFIVRYHDRIVDKPTTRLYIIMEYCSGGDLGIVINKCKKDRTTLDESTIWKIFAQSVLALKDCHRRIENGDRKPILHRDLKPANMLLDSQQNIKMADFGLAKELSSQSKLAKTNVGTPYYMAPEIINEKDYDEKSDIWSLGCVIYELAALKPPFDAANAVSLAIKINKGSFQRIPSKYSDSLHDVIRRMLQVDPKRRPKIEDLELSTGIQTELPAAKLVLSEYRMQQSYVSKCRDIKSKEEELMQREAALSKREEMLVGREQQLKSWEETLQRQQQELDGQRRDREKQAKATGGSSKTHGGGHRTSVEMMMAIEEHDSDQLAYFDDYAPATDRLPGTHPSSNNLPIKAATTYPAAANTAVTSMHPAYFNKGVGSTENAYAPQAPLMNSRPFIHPQPPTASSKTFSSFHSNQSNKQLPPPLPSTIFSSVLPNGKDHTSNSAVDASGNPKRGPVPLPSNGAGHAGARPGFYIYSDMDSHTAATGTANPPSTSAGTTSVPSRVAPPIPTGRIPSKLGDYDITTGAAYDKENVQQALRGKVGATSHRYTSADKALKYCDHHIPSKRHINSTASDLPYQNELPSHDRVHQNFAPIAHSTGSMMDGSPFKRQKQY